MTTAQEIIDDSFIEIGVLPAGDSLHADDLAWGTRKLNALLKTLSAEGLNIPYKVEESFSMVIGTPDYTIGSGGTFNTARPISIQKAFIRDSNDHDHHVSIRPMDEYHDISEKDTLDRPQWLYYDHTFPLGTIHLYYTPNDTESLHIISFKPFTNYTNLTLTVELPGEYEEMLVSNLAIRLGSRYGKRLSAELKDRAKETLVDIKGNNLARTMTGKQIDIPGQYNRSYNIEEG